MTTHSPHPATRPSPRVIDRVQLLALVAAVLFLALGILAIAGGASWLVLLPSALAVIFTAINLHD